MTIPFGRKSDMTLTPETEHTQQNDVSLNTPVQTSMSSGATAVPVTSLATDGDGTVPPSSGDGTGAPADGDGTGAPADGDGTRPPADGKKIEEQIDEIENQRMELKKAREAKKKLNSWYPRRFGRKSSIKAKTHIENILERSKKFIRSGNAVRILYSKYSDESIGEDLKAQIKRGVEYQTGFMDQELGEMYGAKVEIEKATLADTGKKKNHNSERVSFEWKTKDEKIVQNRQHLRFWKKKPAYTASKSDTGITKLEALINRDQEATKLITKCEALRNSANQLLDKMANQSPHLGANWNADKARAEERLKDGDKKVKGVVEDMAGTAAVWNSDREAATTVAHSSSPPSHEDLFKTIRGLEWTNKWIHRMTVGISAINEGRGIIENHVVEKGVRLKQVQAIGHFAQALIEPIKWALEMAAGGVDDKTETKTITGELNLSNENKTLGYEGTSIKTTAGDATDSYEMSHTAVGNAVKGLAKWYEYQIAELRLPYEKTIRATEAHRNRLKAARETFKASEVGYIESKYPGISAPTTNGLELDYKKGDGKIVERDENVEKGAQALSLAWKEQIKKASSEKEVEKMLALTPTGAQKLGMVKGVSHVAPVPSK